MGSTSPIELVTNFSPYEASAKQTLSRRHTAMMEAQQESLAIQSFTDLAVNQLTGVTSLTTGRIDLDDPDVMENGGRKDIAGIVMQNVLEATQKGVKNMNAPDMAWGILQTMYAKTRNTQYLKAADHIEINGTKLSSMPQVASKMEALNRERITRARADNAFYWSQVDRQRKEQEYNLLGTVAKWEQANPNGILNEKVLTEMGVDLRLHHKALNTFSTIKKAEQGALLQSPAHREAQGRNLIQSALFMHDEQTALALYAQTGDKTYLTNYSEGQEDPTLLDAMNEVGKMTGKVFGNLKGEDVFNMSAFDNNDKTLEQERFLEAQTLARATFKAQYDAEVKKNNGKRPSKVEASVMVHKVQAEVVASLQKKYAVLDAQQNSTGHTPDKMLDYNTSTTTTPKVQGTPSSVTNAGEIAFKWLEGVAPSQHIEALRKRNPSMKGIRQYVEAYLPDKLDEYDKLLGGNSGK